MASSTVPTGVVSFTAADLVSNPKLEAFKGRYFSSGSTQLFAWVFAQKMAIIRQLCYNLGECGRVACDSCLLNRRLDRLVR